MESYKGKIYRHLRGRNYYIMSGIGLACYEIRAEAGYMYQAVLEQYEWVSLEKALTDSGLKTVPDWMEPYIRYEFEDEYV